MIASREIIVKNLTVYIAALRDRLYGMYEEHCRKAAEAAEQERRSRFFEQLKAARQEWELAIKMQEEYIEQDLIDFGAYNIKASEMKFRYLSKLARQEGLRAVDYIIDK